MSQINISTSYGSYILVKTPKNFEEAKVASVSSGGYLAEFETVNEATAVWSEIKELLQIGNLILATPELMMEALLPMLGWAALIMTLSLNGIHHHGIGNGLTLQFPFLKTEKNGVMDH